MLSIKTLRLRIDVPSPLAICEAQLMGRTAPLPRVACQVVLARLYCVEHVCRWHPRRRRRRRSGPPQRRSSARRSRRLQRPKPWRSVNPGMMRPLPQQLAKMHTLLPLGRRTGVGSRQVEGLAVGTAGAAAVGTVEAAAVGIVVAAAEVRAMPGTKGARRPRGSCAVIRRAVAPRPQSQTGKQWEAATGVEIAAGTICRRRGSAPERRWGRQGQQERGQGPGPGLAATAGEAAVLPAPSPHQAPQGPPTDLPQLSGAGGA